MLSTRNSHYTSTSILTLIKLGRIARTSKMRWRIWQHLRNYHAGGGREGKGYRESILEGAYL